MMKNEKRLVMALAVVMVLFLSLLIAGGGFQKTIPEDQEDEHALEDDLIVVGFSQLGSESVWRATHTQSIQEALSKENGFFCSIAMPDKNRKTRSRRFADLSHSAWIILYFHH